ncbi:hypothetical protein [Nocardioides litoris]|uniref:hypothetical protein n=1 Tax=Nocardioides litoris TaxID=1926648 RepID=UPI00111FFD41|nr:hypothetical protein [Nocardioides litoris]
MPRRAVLVASAVLVALTGLPAGVATAADGPVGRADGEPRAGEVWPAYDGRLADLAASPGTTVEGYPDGAVLVRAGTAGRGNAAGSPGAVAKLDGVTGEPRLDFGRAGFAPFRGPTSSWSWTSDVAARPDGGALAVHGPVGTYDRPETHRLAVLALDGRGRPDPAYPAADGEPQGHALLPVADGSTLLRGAEVLATADGGAVVTSLQQRQVGADAVTTDVVVQRVRRDGSVDPLFGDGGEVRWTSPEHADTGLIEVRVRTSGLAATPGGGFLVLADTRSRRTMDVTEQVGTVSSAYLLAFDGAGRPVPAFGTAGVLRLPDAQPSCDAERQAEPGLAVGADGRIAVTSTLPVPVSSTCRLGREGVAGHLLLQVLDPDGTPDTAFGDGGRVSRAVQPPGPVDGDVIDVPTAVTLDPQGRLVVVVQVDKPFVSDDPGPVALRFGRDGAQDVGFADGSPDLPSTAAIVPTAGGDYVVAGHGAGAGSPARLATLVLGDDRPPVGPTGPRPADGSEVRVVGPSGRPWRPGDTLTVGLGPWTGSPVDHVDVSLVGCDEPRLARADCRQLPHQQERVSGDAQDVALTLPAASSGQQVDVWVSAVGADGGRWRQRHSRRVVGSSYLSAEEPAPQVPPAGAVPGAARHLVLPDRTEVRVGVDQGVQDDHVRILERRPDERARVVAEHPELRHALVRDLVAGPDGTAHVLVMSHRELYVLDRDPGGAWSDPLRVTERPDGALLSGELVQAQLAVGPGGQAALVHAESEPRAPGQAPPLVVRVRGEDGWGPPEVLVWSADGYPACGPYGCTDTELFERGLPQHVRLAVDATGAVRLAASRRVPDASGASDVVLASADRTPDGTWTQRDLARVADGSVAALEMQPLTGGGTVLVVEERPVHRVEPTSTGRTKRYETRVVSQVALAGAPFVGDGTRTGGQVLLRRVDGDGVDYESLQGARPSRSRLAVDGDHWRFVFTQEELGATRPTPVYAVEGSGLLPATVQEVEGVDEQGCCTTVLQNAAGQDGRALLVVRTVNGTQYAEADGPGPLGALQPLLVVGPDGAARPGPEEPAWAEQRDGSWWVALEGQTPRDWIRPHRLTRSTGAPRVALEPPGDLRAGQRVELRVDPDATDDPDGGPVTVAWDLDDDAAFDDATGPTAAAVVSAPGTAQRVSVRVTAPDGDRAVASQPLSQAANEPPRFLGILGPDEVVAGQPVVLEAVADDDRTSQLEHRWTVDGRIVEQSGREVTVVLEAGDRVVRVDVTDGDGATTTGSQRFTVRPSPTDPGPQPQPDRPPTATLTGPTRVADGDRAVFRVAARDPEGRTLRRAWFVDGRPVLGARGPSATVVLRAGTRTVAVAVADPAGHLVVRSQRVRVVRGSRLSDEPLEVRAPARVGRLVTRVGVPRAGRVRVVLRAPGGRTTWGTASARSTRRGAVPVVVRLTPAGRRALTGAGTRTVVAVVTFRAAGRPAVVRTQRVVVARSGTPPARS